MHAHRCLLQMLGTPLYHFQITSQGKQLVAEVRFGVYCSVGVKGGGWGGEKGVGGEGRRVWVGRGGALVSARL